MIVLFEFSSIIFFLLKTQIPLLNSVRYISSISFIYLIIYSFFCLSYYYFFVIKSLYLHLLSYGLIRNRVVREPNTELSEYIYISTYTSNFTFQQHNQEFNIACMYLLSVDRMDWTVNVL